MHRATLAAALTLIASPVLADAVTYSGTIGKTAIVVEFTAPPQSAVAPFAGRYFYVKKGIDIPLDAKSVADRKLVLNEEKPCTETICPDSGDGTVTNPPLGAEWNLTAAADGKTITGTWTDSGKAQPVALTFVASRPLAEDVPVSPLGLAADTDAFVMGDKTITREGSPYDYLRMQVPQEKSAVTDWSGSSFQYLTDPRTKFAFPTIVALAGRADATAANAYLQARHWSLNADALGCEAQHYAGLGWFSSMDFAAGPLGDYPDESVSVTYLSPTLLSWGEGGSLNCGGAHPYNHSDVYNLDVRTGALIDIGHIFKGWIARTFDGDIVADQADAKTHPDNFNWGPDKALGDLVRAHLKDADVDLSDGDCGYDDLIDSDLAISFKQPDHVVFGLRTLENAIEACAADLYEAPIGDLKDYLRARSGRLLSVAPELSSIRPTRSRSSSPSAPSICDFSFQWA